MDSQSNNTTEPSPSSQISQASTNNKSLPIIDISALVTENPNEEVLKTTVQAIHDACRTWGFFYITNHGVSEELQEKLVSVSKKFFALPLEQKEEIAVSIKDGQWHGYFPVNAQSTGGKPDLKEGLYFMNDIPSTDPRIEQKLPLFSPNQWPTQIENFRSIVVEYIEAVKKLGYCIAKGLALSLGLPGDYFAVNYLRDPTTKLTIVNYPPDIQEDKNADPRYGIGEHTDYGLLTILKQDNSGGLQVRSRNGGWIDATPIENTFVCNLGDMLQLVTNGLYLSNLHRVRNIYTGKERLSFPYFFEPTWDAEVKPLPLSDYKGEKVSAEETASMNTFSEKDRIDTSFRGKYLDYLLAKIQARYAGTQEGSEKVVKTY